MRTLRCSSRLCFFFLMIRRPPRSTLLSLHDALPISARPVGPPAVPRLVPTLRAEALSSLSPTRHDRDAARAQTLRRSGARSEEHTSELQSRQYLVCRLLLEKKKIYNNKTINIRAVRS